MRIKKSLLQNIALFLVLLFHVSGALGILFSSHRDWFIQNTPLNLCLMAVLLVITQSGKKLYFFLFFFIAYLVGFGAEWIGVNTGALFGQYQYGTVLGTKISGVPLLIGINWFIIVYCAGVVASKLYGKVDGLLAEETALSGTSAQAILFVLDGALLTTLFDVLIEPVAVKLSFWQWHNNIPFYNYVCWFGISALLLTVFRLLPFDKNNRLAVHLFIVQTLFFLLLRISL